MDYYAGVSAFQTSPTNVIITNHGVKDDSNTDVTANAQVHDLKVTQNHLFLFGNGGKIMTFEQQKDINHVMPGGEFSLENVDLVTSDDQSIYTLEADRINVRSFQGTIKHTMSLNDDSGGLKLQTKGSYLMVVTKAGIVRIWDVSKRDMRAHCHPLNIKEKIGDFSRVQDVQMNCNATFLSVTLRPPQNSGIIDPKLYIYEIEKDTLRYFNFAAGQNDADDISVPPNSAQSHTIQDDSQVNLGSKFVTNKHVVNHLWDSDEVNFLACYTRCNNDQNQNNSSKSGEMMQPGKPALTSLFVHEDLGVVVHGSQLGMNAWRAYYYSCQLSTWIFTFSASDGLHKLVAVEIPFLVTLETTSESSSEKDEMNAGVSVKRTVMSDFVGLEESDKATRDAVIKFSFYLSIGNMEEAFKSIKTIKNQHVWGNLARMCVKSQRLDVAAICLGKMEHAAGARALRQINEAASGNEEKDVKTAVLAVYLGMYEEAEQLLIRSKRFDLLNKLYQDSGQWEKALEVAENVDRIHLRSTFYNFAKHLEKKGSNAIWQFSDSILTVLVQH